MAVASDGHMTLRRSTLETGIDKLRHRSVALQRQANDRFAGARRDGQIRPWSETAVREVLPQQHPADPCICWPNLARFQLYYFTLFHLHHSLDVR